MFKRCYAMEKIHGTSAHLTFKPQEKLPNLQLTFFSGGEPYAKFVKLFDFDKLLAAFKDLGIPVDRNITVYGEAYGGSQQAMSHTYGKDLKFAVFDVQIGDCWLNVPNAEQITKKLGLEFVSYTEIPTDLAAIDAARDAESVQAIRNGVGPGKKMEGVVLRPLMEMTLNNGNRVISKHKRDDFAEVKSPRPVVDPSQLKVLSDAQAVADEWVTNGRLKNILSHLDEDKRDISNAGNIIKLMIADVNREAAGEIVSSKAVDKAIGKKCVDLLKAQMQSTLK